MPNLPQLKESNEIWVVPPNPCMQSGNFLQAVCWDNHSSHLVSASEFVALPDVQYINNWYSICFLQYFNCFRKDGKYGPITPSVSESGLQKLKGFIFESISYSSLINKSSFTHWFDSVIVLLIDSFIHSTFMCSYKQYLYVPDMAPRPGNSSMDPAHGEFICYEWKQTH